MTTTDSTTLAIHVAYGDPDPITFHRLRKDVRFATVTIPNATILADLTGEGWWENVQELSGAMTVLIQPDQFDKVVGIMTHIARRHGQDCIAVSRLDTTFAGSDQGQAQ